MNKIKAGYLPLYIKLYDDTDAWLRGPLEAYMETLVSMLKSNGVEVIQADVCRVQAEFEAAVRMFNEEDVDVVITQHLAYSPSLESVTALLRLKAEIIVLDTTPDYALADMAGYRNGIDENHGIHGVQDMCNLLKRNGRRYTVCAGHAMHSEVIAEVIGKCRAAAAARAFKNAKVGSAGGFFEGMGDFQISDEEFRSRIGAEVFYLTADKAEKYLNAVTEDEIDAEILADKKSFTFEIEDEESYRVATKTGLAVRKWIEEEKLTAVSVNFLALDKCGLPTMPFVECSKMLARGIGYAGEGDVLTAGLVGALQSVYGNHTAFVEMFCPDWKENLILLSHMGEGNLALAQWKPVLRNESFAYTRYGKTAAAYMCMRPGKAVYLNLAPMGDYFTLIITPVEIVNKGLEFGAYRYAIQGWMRPCKPLGAFLKEYSMLGGTHHSAMVYEADLEEIKSFGEMMGFEVVVMNE